MDSGDLSDGYGVTPAELGGEFDEQEDINIGLQQKGFSLCFHTKYGSLEWKFGHRDLL